MHDDISDNYKNIFKSKIVTNMHCKEKCKLGRNVKVKIASIYKQSHMILAYRSDLPF